MKAKLGPDIAQRDGVVKRLFRMKEVEQIALGKMKEPMAPATAAQYLNSAGSLGQSGQDNNYETRSVFLFCRHSQLN